MKANLLAENPMATLMKEIREKTGLTSKDLAEAIGFSPAAITQFEKADRKISPEAAEKIAKLVQVAGGSLTADTLKAVQWNRYLTKRLPEVKDEQKTPVEKVEVLQNMFRTLEKIEAMDVDEQIKQATREKKSRVEAALRHLSAWKDKDELYGESDAFIEATEEVRARIAG